MNQICFQCLASFTVTKDDRAMMDQLAPVIAGKKFPFPDPMLCVDCREQRRCAMSNQINLYERTCDKTGAMIVSNFHPSGPYKVYREQTWYSDTWDALAYGRVFNFTRPFFGQYHELSLAVPRPALQRGFEFDENADYTNHAGKNKNCYLIFDSDENRDCYYSYSINHCENCTDCYRVRRSELCCECIDCVQCYGSAFLQDCENCAESIFLKNCIGCRSCLMCSNLRDKEYFVENAQVGKEVFEQFRSALQSHGTLQDARERFETLKREYPQKFMHGIQNENVTGDYLVECKNAHHCFDSEKLWDCRYVYQGFMPLRNCMDIQESGDGELLYECAFTGYSAKYCAFTSHTLADHSNLLYCMHAPHCKNCFGCIGTQRKQYCILNKQYSKEEYERLVPKIIGHMRMTPYPNEFGMHEGTLAGGLNRRLTGEPSGNSFPEWGQFFPVSISPFAYNETIAQDYYPLTQSKVECRGWQWLPEEIREEKYMGPVIELSDDIGDAGDDLTKKILRCEASGKPYKIIPHELRLCRQMRLPLPRRRFFQRHKDRMALRNRRVLYARACDECGESIQTSYSPDRPERIFCEHHYSESLL